MDNIIKQHNEEFNKVVNFGKQDMSSIRTNRANSSLVNGILVESYGTKTPLEEVASISAPDSHTIVVNPWDKNILKEVEKALSKSDLGASPNVGDDKVIRINLPPLNKETREKLIKILNEKLEKARESLRSIRDKVKSEIEEKEREDEITEDDKYRLIEELNKKTKEKQKEIEDSAKDKEDKIKGN